ncbi:polysulfide reductase NrfD [Nocardioides maradonensis]
MSTSEYDSVRPPAMPRKRRGGGRRKRVDGGAGGNGNHEESMVPPVEFSSYYGHNIVKPPPWEWPVALYLFVGGVAGGSGVIAAGAQLTGRETLRRNARLGAMTAVGISGAALVADLGKPSRFYNMLRTFKVTSPMSVGSWILTAFSVGLSGAVANEVDRLTGERLPLGPLRRLLRLIEGPAGLEAGLFGPPLAGYTAVLLADTAVPTWNGAHRDLPFVFISSASLASGGLAMITTPVAETGPARTLAQLGVIGDIAAMKYMESRMDPVLLEPLHHGTPGKLLKWAERLAIAGGIGSLFAGRSRSVAVASGAALMTASAFTRFGVFEAGLHSAKDPRYTVEPQKRRLAERRAAGVTHDSITTAG